ncbi:MAG: helix-turn-helix transcriptional regulator, partial [Thermodesulfobacteriota bacterium]
DFAVSCGLSAKHVSQIISGKAPVTPETAIRFERVLGVADDVWNNLEANYRAFHAREKAGQALEQEVAWVKKFPVKQLVNRGFMEKPKDEVHALELVLRFFGVASIQIWEKRYASIGVTYRHSPTFRSELESLATWLRIGEILAQEIQTEPYDREVFSRALLEIRSFTNQRRAEFEPKMKELCRKAGVALAFVPEFPKTHLSGASRWLSSEKALIQLSLRHKTNDHFWFSFFHEAAHLLHHSKKGVYINEQDGSASEEEIAADALAAKLLIPSREFKAFVDKKRFGRKSVSDFAEQVRVAPGIVVGRLQHDDLIPFSHLNGLKVKF